MLNELLIAVESPLADAFNVNGPAVPPVMMQPEKVATPPTAVTGSVVQLPPVPDPELTARVTDAVLFVTR
jgi:hypothetical protein